MVNAKAIVMVFSPLVFVVVLPPHSVLVMSSLNSESSLQSTKEFDGDRLSKMEETLEDTQKALAKDVEVVSNSKQKSMGWFFRKQNDQLNILQEKPDLSEEGENEVNINLQNKAPKKLNLATQFIEDQTNGDKKSQRFCTTKDDAIANKYKSEAPIYKIEQTKGGVIKNDCNSAIEILDSSKEKTLEKCKETDDSICNEVSNIKEKLQDVVASIKDKKFDVGVETKDMTSNIVESSRDKINKRAHHIHDVVVGSLQSGLGNTKFAIADEFEKVKEVVKHSTRDTTDTSNEILEREKNAICKSAECLQSRAQEVGSYSPNLDQRFGHLPSEGQFLEETIINIRKNAQEIESQEPSIAKDYTNSGVDFAKQSHDNMNNIGDDYYYEGKGHSRRSYDFDTNTLEDYYKNGGQHERRAKDYYEGPPPHSYKSPMHVSSQSFYDATKKETNDYFNKIEDKTNHAFNGAYHRAKNIYDNTREIIYNNHNEIGQTKNHYKNGKFKLEKDLGVVAESMGWHRVGIVTPNHLPISSDVEVIIGNVKYEWKDKSEHPSHKSDSNNVKDLTHDISEQIDIAQEHIARVAQNMQDIDIQVKDQIYDTSPKEDRLRQHDDYSWPNHKFEHKEYGDNNENKGDDYISSRMIRNPLKGRMRNRSHLHKSPRLRTNKYETLFLDKKKMESQNLRLWKNIFLKRPEGFLLLLTRALHLFTFSMVYGSSLWVTFVSGFILSKHISRQQFGYVQSRIFPVYLRTLIVGQSILFILHTILHPWLIAESVDRWELSNFGLMIVSTIVNAYVLEPQATKIMFERLKIEKEEGRGLENVDSPVDTKLLMEEHRKKLTSIIHQFKTLHNYSSTLNLISLGALTCHLWHLANRLVI